MSIEEDAPEELSPPMTSHLGLAATLLIFVILVIKVLAVSHFNFTTALGLLSKSGTTEVILGGLILALPTLLLFVCFGLLVVIDSDRTRESDKDSLKVLLLIFGVPAVMTNAWFTAPLLLLIGDMFLGGPFSRWLVRRRGGYRIDGELIEVPETNQKFEELKERKRSVEDQLAQARRRKRRKLKAEREAILSEMTEVVRSSRSRLDRLTERLEKKRRFSRKSFWAMATVLAGLAFLPLALNNTPWVPPEEILLEEGSSWLGYVVAESESELLVLRDEPRQLVRLSIDSIEERSFCQLEVRASFSSSPFSYISERDSEYPECL